MLTEFAGNDRFDVLRRIGTGGFGIVYEVVDRERATRVALKTLTRLDPAALYRFKREFRALADVSHRNLVQLHELFAEKNGWFFTMELVAGRDFLSFVRETERSPPAADGPDLDTLDGPFDPTLQGAQDLAPGAASALRIEAAELPFADPARLRATLPGLALGVAALHTSGMLHRDLKPTNVLVTDASRVVIVDFGIATEVPNDAHLETQAESLIGTPAYMSPEQGNGDPLSPAADWYAIGVMLYEALTGRLPFLGAPLQMLSDKMRFEPPAPRELRRGIPDDLSSLCVELLRRKPESRPRAEEVLRRLGVVSGSPAAAGALHSHQTVSATFVGRTAALERLRAAFERTRKGASVSVYVKGPSGMGKTALVRRFLDDIAVLSSARPIVLSARCYERESVPYKAFDGVVDELSRYLRSLPRAEADALMPLDASVLARVFPVLSRVPSVADAPRRVIASLDAHQMRSRAFGALRDMLARIADRRPLVLFIDDAQWGDDDSAALLAQLTSPPDAPAMMVVITHRSEEEDGAIVRAFRHGVTSPLPYDVEDVVVGALSPEEALHLAQSMLAASSAKELLDQQDTTGLSATIAQESGGNALFLGELVRYVQSSTTRASQTRVRLDLVLRERIEDLDDASAKLLEVLAVAGRPLDPEVARQAAGLSRDEGMQAVAALRFAHFVRSSGTAERRLVEVFHDRVREVMISLLDDDEQRRYHGALADTLRAAGNADPEELFYHLRAAAQGERAAEYAEAAARKAEQAFAFDRAAYFHRYAIDERGPAHPDARALLMSLGSALANAGRGRDAAEAYLRAAEGANEADRLELRRRAAEQLLQSGHVDEGLDAIEAVLRPLGLHLAKTPLRALVAMLILRLWFRVRLRLGAADRPLRDESALAATDLTRIDVCWSVGVGLAAVDTIRASEFQVRNALLCLEAHEPMRLARAISLETVLEVIGGPRHVPVARRVFAHLDALRARAPGPVMDAYHSFVEGALAYFTGRWRPAAVSWEAVREQFEAIPDARWERNSYTFFGLCARVLLGDLLELSRVLPTFLREAEERGNLYLHTNLTVGDTNMLWLAQDDPDGALRVVDDAMERWSHRGFQIQHWYALQARAHGDLYRGDGPGAFARMEAQFGDLRRSLQLRTFVTRLRARHLRGRAAIAAAIATKSSTPLAIALDDARVLARDGCDAALGAAHALRAGVAHAKRDRDTAVTELRRASAAFTGAEMSLYAASMDRALGAVLGGDEGRALRDDAIARITAQGVVDPARFAAVYAPGFD